MFKIIVSCILLLCVSSVSWSLYIVDTSESKYTKEVRIVFENLTLDDLNEVTISQGWNFTRCSVFDQERLGMKAPNLVSALNLSSEAWKDFRFLEPRYTMLGLHWGYISRKFNIPQESSMQVYFTILLDGFNSSSSSNPFLSTNIDFKLSVLNGSGLTMDSVSLKDLNPTNLEWRSYEATFRKTSSFSDPWIVEFGLFKGSDEQNLILSNVSVSWQPIIGSNISREQIPDFTTTTTTTTTSTTSTTTTILNNVTTNENAMNGTTVEYPPDTIDEANSTSSVISANTTSPSNSSTTLPSATSTSPKPSTTVLYNLTTSRSVDNYTEYSGNGTQEAIVEAEDDEGTIGYAGEVVLIVFIVLLAIMVLVVVAKYYHLQKNIGDYRVNPSAEYPNPSFNPQDSYRDH